MANRQYGGASRNAVIGLVAIVILGLAGAVAYLLGDINHRRYRVLSVGDQVVVQRGRFFPVGFEAYTPDTEALQKAYAPIMMPPNEAGIAPEVVEDRSDVDRTLFALLAGWARRGLDSEDPQAQARAQEYIARSELLPAISEEQRKDLRHLRADLAYRRGEHLVHEAGDRLRQALDQFRRAKELGSTRAEQVDLWLKDLRARLVMHSDKPSDPDAGLAPEPESAPTPDVQPQSLEGAPKEKWRL